jgi:hypothetical protein
MTIFVIDPGQGGKEYLRLSGGPIARCVPQAKAAGLAMQIMPKG